MSLRWEMEVPRLRLDAGRGQELRGNSDARAGPNKAICSGKSEEENSHRARPLLRPRFGS